MLNWIHTYHEELQSLAPVATIIAAIIAAILTFSFGRHQLRITQSQRDIAEDKLKLDLFESQYEKRFAVYEATRQFLNDAFKEKLTDDAIKTYGFRSLDAKFLFHEDPALVKLLKDIRDRVTMWHGAEKSAAMETGDEKTSYENIASQQRQWIIQLGDDHAGFDTRFIPFLVYKEYARQYGSKNLQAEKTRKPYVRV